MNFLQPIWLWAAAGVVVPLIIHLWNIKQGKTLKVGSIAFLNETTKSHARSVKLSEWFLLLLRCLLLIVLAGLIAKPFVYKLVGEGEEKGWFLIEKSDIKEVYSQYKPTIDSLVKQGYSFHYFDPSFQAKQFEEALKNGSDTLRESKLSYWSLLKLLNKKVTPAMPVVVFTSNRLYRFYGDRPQLVMNLRLVTYQPTDSVSRWLASAYTTTNDSIRLVEGASNSSGTFFRWTNVLSTHLPTGLSLTTNNGKQLLSLNDTRRYGRNGVVVYTSTLSIGVYAPREAGARYLVAALKAIRDFTQRRISIRITDRVSELGNNDWLFWLSEEPFPTTMLVKNVFVYAGKGAQNSLTTMISQKPGPSIAIYKTVGKNEEPRTDEKVIWKDGFGNPILSQKTAAGNLYRFYSRFDPAWSELVWSGEFALLVYQLITSGTNDQTLPIEDKRAISYYQAAPSLLPGKHAAQTALTVAKEDFTRQFWLVAFSLFVIERFFASKHKKAKVYG